MNHFYIRNMTPADILMAVKIEEACFSLPWSENAFADSLNREDTLFLVCEKKEGEQSQIVGYVGAYISFDEASITNVAVLPEARRCGIGKLLMNQMHQAAKEAGATHMFLEVRVSNEAALTLYRGMGYENLGVRKNFYEHPTEDAYIMSCPL